MWAPRSAGEGCWEGELLEEGDVVSVIVDVVGVDI